jgi:hypothetical protein
MKTIMFSINDFHSNRRILLDYCGILKNLPVWGEIQHSLWFSSEIRSWNESRFFPKIFTWNNLLNLKHQVPIGDPYLYLPKLSLNNSFIEQFPEILVVPKFRRQSTQNERIQGYCDLLKQTSNILNSDDSVIGLLLHSDETVSHSLLYNHLSSRLKKSAVNIVRIQEMSKLEYLNCLVAAKNLTTDYLGAHVFRRCTIGQRDSVVFETWKTNYKVTREIEKMCNEFMQSESCLESRGAISASFLGSEFIREPSELIDILGLAGIKRILGPVAKEMYQTYSNAKERLSV